MIVKVLNKKSVKLIKIIIHNFKVEDKKILILIYDCFKYKTFIYFKHFTKKIFLFAK